MNPQQLVFTVLLLTATVVNANQNAIIEHNGQSYLGLVGTFNRPLPSSENGIFGRLVLPSESNANGCNEWSSDDTTRITTIKNNNNNNNNNDEIIENNAIIAAINRGECTFLDKTLNAQNAGATHVLIIDENNDIVPMGSDSESMSEHNINSIDEIIPSIMIGNDLISSIKQTSIDNNINNNNNNINDGNIIINIKEYKKQIFDFSMIIMIFIATFLVGLGAYYSSDIERSRFYNGAVRSFRQQQPTQEINTSMAWSFVIVASLGLLTLFYFIKHIFYVILFVFVIGATNGLTAIGAHCIEIFKPSFDNIVVNYADIILTKSELIAMIPSFCVSLIWFLNRDQNNAWILQDFMCIGLLMVLQRTLRMSNLKIATILLNMAFLYDIFWVFISPVFFEKSVMVEVATYSHGSPRDTLPVVLKLPRINDVFHSPMILGLGDIALPGLLISYLLRYDYQSKVNPWQIKNGYFLVSLIGYCIGMGLTDINLVLMQHGQPALLFLVPCTLWFVSLRAYNRGELRRLWNGTAKVSTNGHGDKKHVNGNGESKSNK